MKVWIHDESDAHPTAPHDSGEHLSLEELSKVGVLGFVNQSLDDVNRIANERGYVARDEVRYILCLLYTSHTDFCSC